MDVCGDAMGASHGACFVNDSNAGLRQMLLLAFEPVSEKAWHSNITIVISVFN